MKLNEIKLDDFAVVIGIGHYVYPDMMDIPGAASDARAFVKWLTDDDGGGLTKQNVSILISEPEETSSVEKVRPNQNDIDKAFLNIINSTKKNGKIGRRLYMYMSGHGYDYNRDSIALLLPGASPDTLDPAIDTKAYADYFLKSDMFNEIVLFVDAARTNEPRGQPASFSWPRLPAEQKYRANYFYGYAAKPGQAAYEGVTEKEAKDSTLGGYFTASLIKGLRGGAVDSDGQITSTTLSNYISQRLASRGSEVGIIQMPDFYFDTSMPIVFSSKQAIDERNQVFQKSEVSAQDEKPEETQENPTLPDLIAAHYAADNPDADDLIGVEDEARSFARYITKQNLATPLAIGLFGDWGSGKTFFMRKMQKFTNELQEQGHIDRELHRKSSWCENVVQIEFNAWHYIESNLWASLVEHIFSEMDVWLTKNNKSSTIDELYKVFESAQEVKREAEAELSEAEGAHEDAEKALNDAKSGYEKAVQAHRTLRASDIWTAITQSFKQQQENDPELEKSVKKASKTLGIDELRGSAKKLHDVVIQAGDVNSRSRLLISSLFSRKRSALQYGILVALLALAPLAMGLVWMWVNSLPKVNGMMQSIGAGVAELSALITVIAGWGAVGLRSANNALASLEVADAKLADIIEAKNKQQRENLALAESEVATTEERVNLAEQRNSHAVDAVDKARQRLEAETPRARLTQFLRRRLENADYAKHLGVVSMIRKDFELLSRIMTGEEWTDADREKLVKAGVNLEKARAFERIILYVDDLDRCPADRVVEVLQAVHLLLTFPLFVVVVGVDARWVSRALSLSYQHLLSETVAHDIERAPKQDIAQSNEPNNIENMNHGRESLRVSELIASSHDYLEKIFQVPYWVKPMDKESSKEFIEKLALSSVNDTKEINARAITPDQKDSSGTELRRQDENRETNIDNVSKELINVLKKNKQDKELDRDIKEYGGVQVESEEIDKESTSTTALMLVELPLSKYEIEFMKTLAPNIGRSPRRSKRFFNVYQLVRAGLSVNERSVFVGDDGESLDYRVLMCLLAIVTGSPILAPQMFSEVVDWDEQGKVSLSALIKRISKDATFNTSSEWSRCSGALDILHSLGQDTKTLARVRYWTRRAMRFSFTARPV